MGHQNARGISSLDRFLEKKIDAVSSIRDAFIEELDRHPERQYASRPLPSAKRFFGNAARLYETVYLKASGESLIRALGPTCFMVAVPINGAKSALPLPTTTLEF